MNDRPDNRTAAIALNLTPGFGPRAFMRAVEAFGELGELFSASRGAAAGLGLKAATAASLRASRPVEMAGAENEKAARCGARIITWFDEGYPRELRHLHDPPPVLYLAGPLDPGSGVAVAVVGSRRTTHYGLAAAERIGRELSEAGCTVVSGLAAGIDTAAHRGALEGGGRTAAVYGCGLDVVYPAANRALAGRIAAQGCCVSEFPLGTRPEKHSFPRRNRVISGLSRATVVVEAGAGSGALITADFALEQGRDVWAVPGRVGEPESAGCNGLLADGARLFERTEDLLRELGSAPGGGAGRTGAPREEEAGLDADERALLGCLRGDALFLDELAGVTDLPAARVSALMLGLELKGLVRQLPGKRYYRVRRNLG